MMWVLTIDRHKKISGTSESDCNGYGWTSWVEIPSSFSNCKGKMSADIKDRLWWYRHYLLNVYYTL